MNHLIEDKREQLNQLRKRFNVERLELFGSGREWRFMKSSGDLVRARLRKAESDLASARLCLSAAQRLDTACFHARQAATVKAGQSSEKTGSIAVEVR